MSATSVLVASDCGLVRGVTSTITTLPLLLATGGETWATFFSPFAALTSRVADRSRFWGATLPVNTTSSGPL